MKKTTTLLFEPRNEQPGNETAGYQYSFTELFNCCRGELYHTALKITRSKPVAEDVVHDVFLKVWLKRTEIHSITQLRPYLHTMVKNRVLDIFKKSRDEHLIIKRLRYHYAGTGRPEDRATISHYGELLQKAIQQMPPRQQQVYRFVKELGLSYKATAERMRISGLTVKKHISNAMLFIKDQFRKNGISPNW